VRAETAELSLAAVTPGRCRVEGRVTHANARVAHEATRAALGAVMAENHAVLELDLSGVTSGNSLVLSLMLSWFRLARTRGGELRFVDVPEALMEQIRFTGLHRLLPLAMEVR
jgi:anti-anti-sigma factor